uniref:Uncharacterized protein n=1 Tax=Ditylenchus dipsaci TaxID=166011 RepID=A0A915EQ04_9BILA
MSDKKKAANLVKTDSVQDKQGVRELWAGGQEEVIHSFFNIQLTIYITSPKEDVGEFAKIYSVTKGKLNRKKLQKIRINNYIDSPDYPEDLELQLSVYKKVVEDIQSLSDREVSEQLNLLPKEEAKR